MNITIGIKASPRELDLEINLSEDEFFAQVSEALRAQTPLLLTDTKGEKTLIPALAISFVRVTAQQSHRVGFAIH